MTTSRIRTATRVVTVALLATAAVMLTGCNTIQGMGEDISAAGAGIANLAKDANPGHTPTHTARANTY